MLVRRLVLACPIVVASWAVMPTSAHAKPGDDPTFIDPRVRQPPPTHRFRLGLELGYMRLSAAIDAKTMKTQRFHYVPLLADFAYQAQFLKYLMARPSLAIGTNVGNTLEAMPMIIHPQFHTGYQGSIVGAALGFGWFHPLINRKDVISAQRGGLGEPVSLNNWHVGGEVSFTTRIDKGALSIILRGMGVNGRTMHFELDKRRWRFMFTFNLGWYFGDGSKQRARQAERRRSKAAQGA